MQVVGTTGTRSEEAMSAWALRPGDLSFNTVEELLKHTQELREKSYVTESAVEHLSFATEGDSLTPGKDPLYLVRDGKKALLNHHSFGQICQWIGAQAGEWRKYPAALAQVPLTWKARFGERKDVKILVGTTNPDKAECRAVTSPTYGRIWNNELVEAVHKYVDPNVWTVPDATAFHLKTGFITTNDRKVFIFLVGEKNPITLQGMDKPLYRGFYAWNSEVGDGTCGYAEFLFNSACANRAIIGLNEFTELKIRHTSGAPDRWFKEAVPALKEYVESDTSKLVKAIEAAREKKVARDEKGAMEWLKERGFTKVLSLAAIESAREEARGADITHSPYTVWNLIQGLSAEARNENNNDERVAIELQAGKLMKAVF